ncbi:pyridoxamine 5'-phosphate oxidase family protein [Nostocoides australiense]|nr:pyridoxamine 5'-phosphate oxidase family protein [Tetrasphaera australiensis]
MTEDEVAAFLTALPARPGVLATTRNDGRPHAAPTWYDLDDDGTIVFNTGADTLEGRTLKRTRYASLTVQDDRPPFSFVTVAGRVDLIDDLNCARRVSATRRVSAGVLGVSRSLDDRGADSTAVLKGVC